MLYTKDDMRYTEMCKVFDKEFWEPNRDDTKLFKYMYLVFYMLACKENFFRRFEDYDGYAQFAATVVYLRFIRKWKNQSRVKSLLNYARSSKGFLKIMYQNQEFDTVEGPDSGVDTSGLRNALIDSIQHDYSNDVDSDISDILLSITDTTKEVISQLVYSKDAVITHRVYMSSMLSLLNSITLPTEQLYKLRIKKKVKTKKVRPIDSNLVIKAFEEQRDAEVILWRLPDSYKDIVRTVVNRVRQLLSNDINEATASYALPDDIIDSILASAYTEGCLVPESEDEYD